MEKRLVEELDRVIGLGFLQESDEGELPEDAIFGELKQ